MKCESLVGQQEDITAIDKLKPIKLPIRKNDRDKDSKERETYKTNLEVLSIYREEIKGEGED